MEACFATMFEDIRHERPLIMLLSLTDPIIIEPSKLNDDEINLKKPCFEKIAQTENIKIICCCIFTRTALCLKNNISKHKKRRSNLLKNISKGDEITELKLKTEKHDYEIITKPFKIDEIYYKKSHTPLNNRKVFLIFTEILIALRSTIAHLLYQELIQAWVL